MPVPRREPDNVAVRRQCRCAGEFVLIGKRLWDVEGHKARCEEALARGIVVGVSDRTHRGAYAGLAAVMDHAFRLHRRLATRAQRASTRVIGYLGFGTRRRTTEVITSTRPFVR